MLKTKTLLFGLFAALLLGLSACDSAVESTQLDPQIRDGKDAAQLKGQVQFAIENEQGDFETVCGGSLIARDWVLTARHCITANNATRDNTLIRVGSRRNGPGNGTAYFPERFELYPRRAFPDTTYDIALIKLEGQADAQNAIGYTLGWPNLDTNVSIRGWGGGRSLLQVAVMRVVNNIDNPDTTANEGDTMVMKDIGQGVPEQGDSGAGIWINQSPPGTPRKGRIIGVLSRGNNVDDATAVHTEDTWEWIRDTSGVVPNGPAR